MTWKIICCAAILYSQSQSSLVPKLIGILVRKFLSERSFSTGIWPSVQPLSQPTMMLIGWTQYTSPEQFNERNFASYCILWAEHNTGTILYLHTQILLSYRYKVIILNHLSWAFSIPPWRESPKNNNTAGAIISHDLLNLLKNSKEKMPLPLLPIYLYLGFCRLITSLRIVMGPLFWDPFSLFLFYVLLELPTSVKIDGFIGIMEEDWNAVRSLL